MNRLACLYSVCLMILTLIASDGFSQSVFQMNDQLVTDCKGFLTDSDAGVNPGHYDHNENFTFTICIPGASEIKLDFSSFCTEQDYDILRIFDGSDTFSTQLGPSYSGTNIPPSVTSSGECLTIHFKSDANVTCSGWTASWSATIEAPLLPDMVLTDPNPTCSTSVLTVNFSSPVPCDSILAGAFLINGPAGNTVTNATPVGCLNDSATQATIQLNPGLDESGQYIVTYVGSYLDQCDSLWTLITSDTLNVTDCPLFVDLTASSITICEGECTDLFAEVTGGDPSSYSFSWSPGGPFGPGPWMACPVTTTLYTVTVTDGSGAPPASDTLTIHVLPVPVTQPNFSICETDDPVVLTGTPVGGSWSGTGISDPSGIFDPGLSGNGFHLPVYTAPNGCTATQSVSVLEIWAGPDRAACPGSAPFPLSAASPGGGTWGGPNVSPGGMFSPPMMAGSYKVWYTVAGCSDTTEIFVGNPVITPLDTICESSDPVFLSATPQAGFWSGNGILSSASGEFDPVTAGPGSHTITYALNGCNTSIDIFVKQIDIGNNFTACPSQMPFSLGNPSPAGGSWSSLFGAVTDPLAGIFDPSVNGGTNFTDTLTYSINGCEAKKIAYVRITNIGVDSLYFCREDDPIDLNWTNTNRTPWDGQWAGNGVTDPDFPGTFDPGVAGQGFHKLIYTANTCSDSMIMAVRPGGLGNDTSVCSQASPFLIATAYSSGIWRGEGVTDTLTGLFEAQVAGVGVHEIQYVNPFGCLDTMMITVTSLPVLSIDNLEPQYCYKDSLFQLSGSPAGGTWSGPGIQGSGFNPVLAGTGGPYLLTYTFGVGDCQQSVTGLTNVGPALQASISPEADSLCAGEFVTLTAVGSGGSNAAYSYRWFPTGTVQPSLTVQPANTTLYTIEVNDGCSDPGITTANIFVHPEFEVVIENSDPVCFGEMGYAVANVTGPSVYEILWQVNPIQTGDTLKAPTGFNYEVVITDVESGCNTSALAEIPRFPFINAGFIATPNGECIRLPDAEVVFLDQSVGATMGQWSFGDGQTAPYEPGAQLTHVYSEIGEFEVSLFLENEGGCLDSVTTTVCTVPPDSWLYLPNAFSPNGDGVNDVFELIQGGIVDLDMRIYDRWGREVFATSDPSFAWDGTLNGANLPEGVYVFNLTGFREDDNPNREFRPLYIAEKGTITLIR